MQELEIKFKKVSKEPVMLGQHLYGQTELTPEGKLPTKNNSDDNCWDLYADYFEAPHDYGPVLSDEVVVPKGVVIKIHTNLAAELPKGYGVAFKPRSGLATKGLVVLGGEIDNGYRGEWMVLVANVGPDNIKLSRGDRIAQFRLVETTSYVVVTEVEELSDSERGEKGFGSSGK